MEDGFSKKKGREEAKEFKSRAITKGGSSTKSTQPILIPQDCQRALGMARFLQRCNCSHPTLLFDEPGEVVRWRQRRPPSTGAGTGG